jgi:L-iditol 2-dehydrogenase
MRVARLHGAGDIRLSDEPIPSAGDGMALVRVTAVGLCGSDLHWFTEAGIGDARLDTPLVVGHEFAGVIEGGPRHGQRVAVDPAIPCRACDVCLTGDVNLCPSVVFAGHGGKDGALQQYVAWPAGLLHPLPATLSDADGALLEPLGVAIHAFDLGHVRVGAAVGVFGCGPLGLLLIQVARAGGATTVLASDPLAHRREAARRLGADLVVDPTDGAALREVLRSTGVDTAFEVAGTDAAVDDAMLATRPGGRVVLAGIPDGDHTTFRASLARRKGLTIALVRRMKDVYPRALRLVASGAVDVTSLATHEYPLDQIGEALRIAVAREGLKVVVRPS